jgi:hypothetical protein
MARPSIRGIVTNSNRNAYVLSFSSKPLKQNRSDFAEHMNEVNEARLAFLSHGNRDRLTRRLGCTIAAFTLRSNDAVKLHLYHCGYVSRFYT